MTTRPRRTGSTGLDEDVLPLFDAAFFGWLPLGMLRKKWFSEHHNCSYSHRFDDAELDDVLASLVRDEMFQWRNAVYPEGAGLEYRLAERGGKLWEAERLPVWPRYLTESSWPDGAHEWLEVQCLSRDLGLQFLETAFRCRLYAQPIGEIIHREIENDQDFAPWRAFDVVHVLTVAIPPEVQHTDTDWRRYEEERCWWRTINELQKFQSP